MNWRDKTVSLALARRLFGSHNLIALASNSFDPKGERTKPRLRSQWSCKHDCNRSGHPRHPVICAMPLARPPSHPARSPHFECRSVGGTLPGDEPTSIYGPDMLTNTPESPASVETPQCQLFLSSKDSGSATGDSGFENSPGQMSARIDNSGTLNGKSRLPSCASTARIA